VNRRHLGIAILVVWVGALGWLVSREIARRGRTVIAGRQAVSPGAAYYSVELNGIQVGYSLLQIDTLAPTDTSPALVQLESRLLISAGAAPGIERYEFHSTSWLTTDLRLWRAEALRGDPNGVAEWKLVMRGDTLITLFIDGTSRWTSATLLDTIPIPTEAVPLWIATYGGPRPGRSISVPSIDLASLSRRRETWIATAESTFTVPDSVERIGVDSFRVASVDTVLAWRIGGTDRSVQVHRWIDENGFPIQWSTGGGWTLERKAFEMAIAGFRVISDSVTGRSTLQGPLAADAAPSGRPADASGRSSSRGRNTPHWMARDRCSRSRGTLSRPSRGQAGDHARRSARSSPSRWPTLGSRRSSRRSRGSHRRTRC